MYYNYTHAHGVWSVCERLSPHRASSLPYRCRNFNVNVDINNIILLNIDDLTH